MARGAAEGHLREQRRLRDRARRPAIRGPGEFLGARQSGVPMLRFADLERDAALIEAARDAAEELLRERSRGAAAAHVAALAGRQGGVLQGLKRRVAGSARRPQASSRSPRWYRCACERPRPPPPIRAAGPARRVLREETAMNRLVNLFRIVAVLLAAVAAGCATGPAGRAVERAGRGAVAAGRLQDGAGAQRAAAHLPAAAARRAGYGADAVQPPVVRLPGPAAEAGVRRHAQGIRGVPRAAPAGEPAVARSVRLVAAAGRRDDRRFQALRRRPRQLVAGVR